MLSSHPIDVYCAQLDEFEDTTFFEYINMYKTYRMKRRNQQCYGEDRSRCRVYETNEIIRFTNFYPTYSTEGFFFNDLLRNVCFRNENDLISSTHTEQICIHECYQLGIVNNLVTAKKIVSDGLCTSKSDRK